jgi:hypothetical protein
MVFAAANALRRLIQHFSQQHLADEQPLPAALAASVAPMTMRAREGMTAAALIS